MSYKVKPKSEAVAEKQKVKDTIKRNMIFILNYLFLIAWITKEKPKKTIEVVNKPDITTKTIV